VVVQVGQLEQPQVVATAASAAGAAGAAASNNVVSAITCWLFV
jgi:hypothetical protein